ncbi:MAG: guanylate kinase, partial [Candidatus Daviesbacteria bacterium]|nr:guanylate kinase [Candidatus Daviesbacteria bacterium]
MNKPLLIILTGKTASGKDTVISRLLSRLPDFKKVVTVTSRAPRVGEKDGMDYFFLSREDFKQKIEKGDFIEYVEYGGNFYGTEKTQLADTTQGLIW